MTPSWIEDVWENGQHKQLHATDSSFDKHKCPIFKGLVITVSQLSTSERSELQAIIEENGGSYLAPLKARETTHLVLSDPIGDKYRYAKNWKIFCINTNWVFDSVEAGYCKDENLYKIENTSKLEQPKRSTPNRDSTLCDLPTVDCSAITVNTSFVTHLDETMKSDVSFPVAKKNGQFPSLDEFDLSSLPKYGQFLDGCKIFLTGFNSTHMAKLRKIVNSSGGMRFSTYSESISHVVVGDFTADFLQSLKSSSVKPHIVKVDWLLECCRKESLVDEEPFLCMNATLLSPEKNEPEPKPVSASQTSKPLPRSEDTNQDNITDIFKQYICEQNGNSSKKSESDGDSLVIKKPSTSWHKPHQAALVNQEIEVVDLEEEECTTGTQLLFAGLKFIIVGFGDKDTEILAKMIETHAGTVFSTEDSSNVDIAVVPIIKHDYTICASNVVTNCWLQKCIEDSRMFEFDENELFRPVEIPIGSKPFESFVISVSQYSGTERDCLMHLAEVLGATCQEYFVRKANKSRGILSNTHLVVATPDGSKYEAAKKWKIPAVTKYWVLDAANLGAAPPLDKYLVDACIPIDILSNPEFAVNSKGKENVNQDIKTVFAEPTSSVPSRRSSVKIAIEKDFDEVKMIDNPIPDLPMKSFVANLSTDTNPEPLNQPSHSSTPRQLNKLCNDNKNNVDNFMSPLILKPESSVNESLSFNQSYKHKFHVSGLLKDLDSSVSQDHSMSTSMKRQSLPFEELFNKKLASGLRGVNTKVLSQNDNRMDSPRNSFIEAPCPQSVVDNAVLKGAVVCVSKKLVKLQAELIEIVASLGGDYQWSYDNTCTHFVFTGKANDLTKEFREARSQGKKIVCPQWVYACKETQTLVDEELYPHTLKLNMSLTGEIAIVKTSIPTNISENDNVSTDAKQDTKANDVAPIDNDGVDFNQQLNDLLVAAKSAKRRQSKRVLNSVSSSPNNEISPLHGLHKQISVPAKPQEEVDTQETCSQQSQSCPVVWDDPTGRMEREKIAALAAAQINKAKDNPSTSTHKTKSISKSESRKRNSSIFSCDGLVEEVFMELPKADLDLPSIKKFMFTNIPDSKKLEYIGMIKNLGGEVSDEKAFDLTATHLISEKPIKNEKLLSSVASGKWVIHPQYLIASQEQNKFVPEEEFEWGGAGTEEFLSNLPMGSRKLARCPFRWRVKLNGVEGAFQGWKVVVIADDKAKQSTYVKILEAGSAEVLPSDASSSTLHKLSHAIVDMKKRTLSQLDLNPYISNNIKCIKPEYLAFFLIEDPSPDVENFIIPEAKELMGGAEQSSKRRNLSVATRGSKRTKLT